MKRLTKEYKLDVCDNINLKYGTVNKDNPQVVYISGCCWISPQQLNTSYETVIDKIRNGIKRSIKSHLINTEYFDEKFIFDFETYLEDAQVGDKKYLSFDIYLRQHKTNVRKLSDLDSFINERFSVVSNDIVSLFKKNNFMINKKKDETNNKIDRIGFASNYCHKCEQNS